MNTNIPQVILERNRQLQLSNPDNQVNKQKSLEQLAIEFRAIQTRVAEYTKK
jgi:hypothetical protein